MGLQEMAAVRGLDFVMAAGDSADGFFLLLTASFLLPRDTRRGRPTMDSPPARPPQ